MKIADEIIAAVCADHRIPREQLTQTGIQTRGVTLARKDAIRRLRMQHFSSSWIAKFLNMSRPGVDRHLYPNIAKSQNLASQRCRKRKRLIAAAQKGTQSHLVQ